MRSSDENTKLGAGRADDTHLENGGQPALPVADGRFANPSPLGLLSCATGI